MTWLAGPFLIAHGLIAARFDAAAPVRSIAVALALAAPGTFIASGVGVLASASWSPGLAAAGAVLSTLLTVAFLPSLVVPQPGHQRRDHRSRGPTVTESVGRR